MLELWKPIFVKANYKCPVIFNVFGDLENKPYRPFVIFYDDQEDCYYYLRARSATQEDKKNKTIFPVKNNGNEVLVVGNDPAYEPGPFFKDSLVDCSQIFKCKREILEKLVDIDELYLSTNKIKDRFIEDIKKGIFECVMKSPPFLSILEIELDENGTSAKSLYLSEEVANREMKYEGPNNEVPIYEYLDFASNPTSGYKYQNQRYQNGINFCEMFLKEYFPNQVYEFRRIQSQGHSQ